MESPPIKIRAYKDTDLLSVMAVFKRNVPKYFSESEADDLEAYLKNETEIYLVAELENTIVGAGGINFENSNQTGIISWDFIDPNFQGKGIGRELLNHRIGVLKSMDSIKKVRVRTSQLTYRFY